MKDDFQLILTYIGKNDELTVYNSDPAYMATYSEIIDCIKQLQYEEYKT